MLKRAGEKAPGRFAKAKTAMESTNRGRFPAGCTVWLRQNSVEAEQLKKFLSAKNRKEK